MTAIRFFIVLFFIFPGSFTGWSQDSGNLILEIDGFRNDKGKVAIAVHNNEEGFPGSGESRVAGALAEIKNGKARAVIESLPFGEYAVSVFHDENGNGELDTNWLGIPKEGVGASNNAKSRMGPPNYEDAKFNFDRNGQTVKFSMDYIL